MISVILVTYNSINVLSQCLESLENCSNPQELEIILIDNQSIDNTWQWIARYKEKAFEKFASIKSLQLEQNLGYAFANNRGADIVSGDFILLLNPDTIVGKRTIEECQRKMKSDKTIGAVGCRLVLKNGKLDKACRRSLPTLWNSFTHFSRLAVVFPKSKLFASYNLTYLDEKASYEVGCLCGAFILMTASLYKGLGGLDEDYFMYGEDVDLCYRIKKSNYKLWYEGTLSTIHLKGGNGGKRTKQSLWHFYKSMYLYCEKTRTNATSSLTCWLLKGLILVLFYIHVILNSIRKVS